MGATQESSVELRQFRRRLQRKYLAKRLIRRRRSIQPQESYIVSSLKPVGVPP